MAQGIISVWVPPLLRWISFLRWILRCGCAPCRTLIPAQKAGRLYKRPAQFAEIKLDEAKVSEDIYDSWNHDTKTRDRIVKRMHKYDYC